MKIRRHKNNRTFRISFRTRAPSAPAPTKWNGSKWSKTSGEGPGSFVGRASVILAVGSDEPSVLRAFLFGRDASNIRATIFEARTV